MAKLNKYDTLVHALQGLRLKGYKYDFDVKNGKFIHRETKKEYKASDLGITEYHRFEGMSNPGDSSVVFALIASDGQKGVLTTSYGTYSDPELMNTLEKVKILERENSK
ncbi:MAG: phosphoribosylpyrophosphate synthetase [Bacteroidetes bacterium]|nr:phosphoribosylpyrophosphate synthetase [Bacteroidota bacterium]